MKASDDIDQDGHEKPTGKIHEGDPLGWREHGVTRTIAMSHAALGAPDENISCILTSSRCPGGTSDILPILYCNVLKKKATHGMMFWRQLFLMANTV